MIRIDRLIVNWSFLIETHLTESTRERVT